MERQLHASSGETSLRVRPARTEDTKSLAQRIRPADRAELEASLGFDDPEAVLLGAILFADVAMVGVDNEDKPHVLFGLQLPKTVEWPFAAYFMVAAEGIEKHTRQLVRESRLWIEALQEASGYIPGFNHVDERNKLHIRWLEWCGAHFTGRRQKRADPDTNFLEFILPCVIQSQRLQSAKLV